MKTGGQAFPGGESYESVDPAGNSTRHSKAPYFKGMTIRDYFAAKAMQGFYASLIAEPESDPDYFHENVAKAAYKQADAMLAEREKEVK